MRRLLPDFVFAAFCAVLVVFYSDLTAGNLQSDTVRIMDYNLLNYPGSDAATRDPYFRRTLALARPDVLIVEEMTSQAGVTEFFNNVLNYYTPGVYSTIPFHDGPDTDPHIYYKAGKVTFISSSVIPTDLRDIGEFVIRINSTGDTIRLYAVHLKASSGTTNEQQRLTECTTLRNYLNTLPTGTRFMIMGDFNFYRSSEPGMVKLLESQANDNGRAKDPLNLVGPWQDNASFAAYHTQSPRVRSFGGGATGGMDDRFDLILTSYSSLDNNIIPSSYKAFGNDGNHLNDSINRLPNNAVPDSVANALHYSSDHIPVVCDFVFTSASPGPGAFAQLSPPNGAAGQPFGGTLRWNTSAGASGYDVYFGTSNPPTTVVSTNQADTTWSFSGLSGLTTCYWKIVARGGTGSTTATGAPWSFTTMVSPPGAFSLLTPAAGTTDVPVNGSLTWQASPNTAQYDVYLSTANPPVTRVSTGQAGTAYAYSGLAYGTPYYWKIVAKNSTDTAVASGSPRMFTTIPQYTISATAGAHGTVTPSGSLLVTSGMSQAFVFSPATGYHTDSVIVDGIRVDSATGYTFTNVTSGHSLRVTFALNQYFIAASSGANGSITPSGSIAVFYGDNAAFHFIPATGHHVDSLIVDGIRLPADTGYSFASIQANHTIRVTFAIDQFPVTASVSGSGSVTPSGTVMVNYGADQTFAFTAASGYHLDSILVDGLSQPPAPAYTFISVTSAHSIRAVFAINRYQITASAGPNGQIAPSGTITVNDGDSLVFTFAPSPGYFVSEIAVDGIPAGVVGSYTFRNIHAGHSISVAFNNLSYIITAEAGPGGQISPSGTVEVGAGAEMTFILAPVTGYHIDSLIVDGTPVSSASSYTFISVSAPHAVRCVFAINKYAVSASATQGGSVSPSGTILVSYGDSLGFTFLPSTGYHLSDVEIDGVPAGPLTTYIFRAVSAAHTIHAIFLPNHFQITATAGPGGRILPAGSVDCVFGSDTTFTIIPDAGFHIDSVIVDGAHAGSTAAYSFTSIADHHTISVTFARVTVELRPIVVRGWNLLSVPVTPADPHQSSVYPTAVSRAFQYNGSYLPADILAVGTGYWVKFSAGEELTLTGVPADAGTVEVHNGWNMVGSVSAPVPVQNVITSPPGMTTSEFFGYTGGKYVRTSVLNPGYGYWVKVSGTGTLTVTAATGGMAKMQSSAGNIHIVVGSAVPPAPPSAGSLDAGREAVPSEFVVPQNVPNPFNPSTTIRFGLPSDAVVTVEVTNILGSRIAAPLTRRLMQAGWHSVVLDGSGLSSGVYLYRVTAEWRGMVNSMTGRMLLVR